MMHELQNGDLAALPYVEALERIRSLLQPLEGERVAIEHAVGRVPTRDLVAPAQIPARPLAARDGFALRAAETSNPDRQARLHRFQIVGCSFPGDPDQPAAAMEPGQAVAISAGAPLPVGADAILPAEMATIKDEQLLIGAAVRPGAGVLFPGDDIRDGAPIVFQGRPLTPAQLGLLSATGLSHIEVHRTPRIGLLAGQAGAPSVALAMRAWCAHFRLPTQSWILDDNRQTLTAALKKGVRDCDALVVLGSTRGGPLDRVHDALDSPEGTLLLEGVRLRPGRNTSFGTLQGRAVFLLTGNPTAIETAFLLLVLPGLLVLGGATGAPFPVVPARLSRDLKRTREQKKWTQVVRVQLDPGPFFLQAVPLISRAIQQKRGRLAASAAADGLVLLEGGDEDPRAGDIIGVILLGTSWS